jgi:hypothetical protein
VPSANVVDIFRQIERCTASHGSAAIIPESFNQLVAG